jgi:hypothetical protein
MNISMWRLLFDETTVKKIWQLVHALDLLQTEYKGYRNQTASTCSGSTTEYKGYINLTASTCTGSTTEYKGYRNQTASTCSGSTTKYKGYRN